MKVEFIKDHVINKAGATEVVSKERANYLIRTGVAKKHTKKDDGEPDVKVKEEKTEGKHTKEEKKDKAFKTKSLKG